MHYSDFIKLIQKYTSPQIQAKSLERRNAVYRIPPEFAELLHFILPVLQRHIALFCGPHQRIEIFNLQPSGNFLKPEETKADFWCDLEFDVISIGPDEPTKRFTTNCLCINFSTGAIIHPDNIPDPLDLQASIAPDKLLGSIPEIELALAWSKFFRSYNTKPQRIYRPLLECISFLDRTNTNPDNFSPLSMPPAHISPGFLGTLSEANQLLAKSMNARRYWANVRRITTYPNHTTLFPLPSSLNSPQIPAPKGKKREACSLDNNVENGSERSMRPRVGKRNGSL